MTTKIIVDPDWNLPAIAAAAGGGAEGAWAEENAQGETVYSVPGVEQAALDQAAAAYDHAAELAARERLAKIAELASSDAGMARVVEDLIAALEARGLLAFGDLPPEAQEKIEARRALRAQIG